MAEFAPAFAATMKAEGGYVNDPQDPGGETYKGVARKMNSKLDGWTLIGHHTLCAFITVATQAISNLIDSSSWCACKSKANYALIKSSMKNMCGINKSGLPQYYAGQIIFIRNKLGQHG